VTTRPSAAAGSLLRAAGLAALALPGALPGARGVPDPVALLVWLACVAAPIGALAGGRRTIAFPHAAAIPGAWMILLALVDASAPRDLATPLPAGAAVAGLFLFGFAAGRAFAFERALSIAGALLGLGALLVLLPLAGGWLAAPWPGPWSAILLDLSPATLLVECAGVDWLRHPAVYDAAGTADLDPARRGPFAPALAGGIALVLGCVLAVLAARIDRRHAPVH
jgi:hypothetical protein